MAAAVKPRQAPRPEWDGPLLPLGPLLAHLPRMPAERAQAVSRPSVFDGAAPGSTGLSINWLAAAVRVRDGHGDQWQLAERTWARFAVEGVDPWMADRLATAVGLLPYEIWPEWAELITGDDHDN